MSQEHLLLIFLWMMAGFVTLGFSMPKIIVRYQKWQQDRADRKAIGEALVFMSQWKRYDNEKAKDTLSTFATTVESLKRRVYLERATDASVEFDESVRRMMPSNTHFLDGITDEQVIDRCVNRGK